MQSKVNTTWENARQKNDMQAISSHFHINLNNRVLGNRSIIADVCALFALCVVTVAYLFLFVDKGMPLSEGWYTEYAWRLNEGQLPYEDFALAFPPLYSCLIAGFTKIFGYKIILLRILGIIVFVLRGVIIYLIFRSMFSTIPAFIASVVTPFVIFSSEVSLITYDYLTFCDLAVYLSIFFCIRSVKSEYGTNVCVGKYNHDLKKKEQLRIWPLLLTGLFAGFAIQLKQSVGLAMLLFFIVFFAVLCICSRRTRRIPILCGAYLLGVILSLVPLFVFLFVNGLTDSFMQNCVTGAIEGKGGIATELFAWLYRARFWFFMALPACCLLLSLSFVGLKYSKNWSDQESTTFALPAIVGFIFGFAALIVAIILILYAHPGASRNISALNISSLLTYVYFLFPSVLFFIFVVRFIIASVRNELREADCLSDSAIAIVISGSAFAIAYSVGLSGGLSACQMPLGAGLAFGIPLHYLLKMGQGKAHLLLFSVAVIVVVSMYASVKYQDIFNWWGLDEGSIWEQTERAASVDVFDGLKINARNAACYEGVYEFIGKQSIEGLTIFVFPHCPILYDVTGYHSDTYTVVQWFDVSSKEYLESDTAYLYSNSPTVMCLCDIPDSVIEAHESWFGASWTENMQNDLRRLANDKYSEVSQYDIGNGYSVHLYLLNVAFTN